MGRRPVGPSRRTAGRLPPGAVSLLRRELREDRADRDVTVRALAGGPRPGTVVIEVEADGVLSGVDAVTRLARSIRLRATPLARDGERVRAGRAVLRISGDLRWILSAERTILNALMHLSGVATATARVVDAVRGSGSDVAVYATRKTLPGLRALEKAAVVHGGGHAHRRDLSESFLYKAPHAALAAPDEAVLRLRRAAGRRATVQVEVRDVGSALSAIRSGADALLFDNLTPAEAARAIAALARAGLRDRVWIELSGGITLAAVPRYARAGADAISLGSLTHSAKALPFHVRSARARVGRRAGRSA